MDRPPPRFMGGGEEADEERELAARSAFTAWDFAQNVDRRFHPRTWQAVRGSPYERMYRQQFKVPEQTHA